MTHLLSVNNSQTNNSLEFFVREYGYVTVTSAQGLLCYINGLGL